MVAKKKIVDPKVKELREFIKAEKVVIGTDRTLKMLRTSKLSKVFLSSNSATDVKNTVTTLCALGSAELVQMENTNEEIGEICKKPFSISLIGILR